VGGEVASPTDEVVITVGELVEPWAIAAGLKLRKRRFIKEKMRMRRTLKTLR